MMLILMYRFLVWPSCSCQKFLNQFHPKYSAASAICKRSFGKPQEWKGWPEGCLSDINFPTLWLHSAASLNDQCVHLTSFSSPGPSFAESKPISLELLQPEIERVPPLQCGRLCHVQWSAGKCYRGKRSTCCPLQDG